MAKIQHRPVGQKEKIADLRRGEIYLCSFDPTIGHKIKKTRPALVVQNDVGNRYSALTIVAAITSSVSPVRHPVVIIVEPATTNGLVVRSSIRLDQIRNVDRLRLARRLGVVDSATMLTIDEALKVSLGLVGL